jgi:hypothetical protein
MIMAPGEVEVIALKPHYARGPEHNYANVWRAYWTVKELLTRYDKVLYIATDAYVCSQRLVDYLEGLDSGWTALWCPQYKYPEAQIQAITAGCKEFEEFFAGDCDPFKYNGLFEEKTLPFTHVERGFVGDRYHELSFPPIPYEGQDYFTQVTDSYEWDDRQFPVLRRVAGKVVVQ